MSEYKTIPSANQFEIDKEGNIQRISNKTQIFPYPLGSNNVKLLLNDGSRKPFLVSDLIEEVFNVKIPVEQPKAEEVAPKGTTGVRGQCAGGPIGIPQDELENKILALDTFTSVKIWKLHQSGIKNDRIMELVGPSNQGNVISTISNFKKSEKLRDKADKVKI